MRLQITNKLVDASQFWERTRILYNILLASISLACWGREMLFDGLSHLIAGIVVLAFFGLAANLCYCAAYPLDVVLQFTSMRNFRIYVRWLLFTLGTMFASACALYVLLGDQMA